MKNIKSQSYGMLLACISAFSTGLFGMFLILLDNFGIDEMSITIFTPLFPGLAFLIISLVRNPRALLLKKKIYYFTLVIGSGMILFPLYNYTYVKAYTYLPMAIASLFSFCNSIVLIFLMRLFFKKKITKQKIICAVVALIGLMLVLDVFTDVSHSDISGLAILWGIAVAISLAASYTIDYFHVQVDIEPFTIQTYSSILATIPYFMSYSPISFINNISNAVQTHGVLVLLTLFAYGVAVTVSYGGVTSWCYS